MFYPYTGPERKLEYPPRGLVNVAFPPVKDLVDLRLGRTIRVLVHPGWPWVPKRPKDFYRQVDAGREKLYKRFYGDAKSFQSLRRRLTPQERERFFRDAPVRLLDIFEGRPKGLRNELLVENYALRDLETPLVLALSAKLKDGILTANNHESARYLGYIHDFGARFKNCFVFPTVDASGTPFLVKDFTTITQTYRRSPEVFAHYFTNGGPAPFNRVELFGFYGDQCVKEMLITFLGPKISVVIPTQACMLSEEEWRYLTRKEIREAIELLYQSYLGADRAGAKSQLLALLLKAAPRDEKKVQESMLSNVQFRVGPQYIPVAHTRLHENGAIEVIARRPRAKEKETGPKWESVAHYFRG